MFVLTVIVTLLTLAELTDSNYIAKLCDVNVLFFFLSPSAVLAPQYK